MPALDSIAGDVATAVRLLLSASPRCFGFEMTLIPHAEVAP